MARFRKLHTNLLLKICLVAALGAVVGPAQAQDTRGERGYVDRLLSNAALLEGWHILVADDQIRYDCVACNAQITGVLDILRYEAAPFGTPAQRYLSERARLCHRLTSQRLGRCMGTDPHRLRPGLSGYVSELEYGDQRQIELVYFARFERP